MYSSNKTTKTHKTGGGKAECCADSKCETGLRNNYFEGKRLTADSFRIEQKYAIERRRLLNRAIHGWGVVYGYGIDLYTPEDSDNSPCVLKVSAGLALDKCGRELIETGRGLKLGDLIILDADGKRIDLADANLNTKCWLLSVHYAEQDAGPFIVEDSCRCKYREWDHICETVRYSIKPYDCDDCCKGWPCELNCDCGTGRCCDGGRDYNKSTYEDRRRDEGKRQQRGGCRCICDHLTGLKFDADCDHLCEIEEPCGSKVRVDIGNGVPLACINIIKDRRDCPAFGDDLEDCGPRRLVKRNDLLFDLIRGCDLTTIIDFGWKDWHRSDDAMPFDVFADGLGPEGKQKKSVSNLFWVEFSRPVRANTLRADCFAMNVLASEREGGWWTAFRVPIIGVDTSDYGPKPDDPPGHVYGAAIVVDGRWLYDAVRGSQTIFIGARTRVEIEVRGDLIVDCNGQTVDANSFGLFRVPTGNATAGGTFLSTFRVEPAPAPEEPSEEYSDYDSELDKGV